MKKSPTINQGFSVIEILIVTAIVTSALTGFLYTEVLSVRLLRRETDNLEATLLAQEGMEAVRSLRDESWTNNITPLVNGTLYYPIVENSKWKLITAPTGLINGRYTRQIIFDQVFRDSNDNIASTGTVDADTRKVISRVLWNDKQIELTAYLTNFQGSLTKPTEAKVISYEGATTDSNLANFPSANAGDGDPAQSFTTLASDLKVTRIDALMRSITSNPSDIYAEIRASPIGAVLGASSIITGSTITTTTPAWVEFRFNPAILISSTTLYYIRMRSIPSSTTAGSGSSGTIQWSYLQTPSSPYSGGAARRYIEHLANPLDAGVQLDQYDFGFKIYALQ